jgi:hypothetical protein
MASQDFMPNDGLPLVLKATLYKDFGSATQSEVHVFEYLSRFKEKKNLLTIQVD